MNSTTNEILSQISKKDQVNSSSNNIQSAPAEKNAFLIKLSKGASLTTIKKSLKSNGCHWHEATKSWSCPLASKESVDSLLKQKKIKATLTSFQDNYFNKSESKKKADNQLLRSNMLTEQLFRDQVQLSIDEKKIEKDIACRELPNDHPTAIALREEIQERNQKLKEREQEIVQLKNSASLLENEVEYELPFRILGYNEKLHVLIWYQGRILELSASQIRQEDELKLLVGYCEDYSEIKEQIISKAHAKGFVNNEDPIKTGIWKFKDSWLIISGKRSIIIDKNGIRDLVEPVYDGKIIKFDGISWIDLNFFESEYGKSSLQDTFDEVRNKVALWNWTENSMADYVTALLFLTPLQHAMSWRPWCYLSGSRGTGKTTFYENIMQEIFGSLAQRIDKGTAHATAQTIGGTGTIAILDEFEKHKHIGSILELFKLCNKGGNYTSGTPGEKANSYKMHHMPWFGSIYLPKQLSQDSAQESRIIKFELKKLKDGTPMLEKIDSSEGPKLAAQIIASMIYNWDLIENGAKSINRKRNDIIKRLPGIEIRTVENFMYASSVLNLVTGEEHDVPEWAAQKVEDDSEKIVSTIMSSLIKIDDERHSIFDCLVRARSDQLDIFRKPLENFGLKLTSTGGVRYLAIRCPSVVRFILQDTDYKNLDIQAPLSRIEGAISSHLVKFSGKPDRCVLIPFDCILDGEDNVTSVT